MIRVIWLIWAIQIFQVNALAGAWALESGKGQIISTTIYDRAYKAYDDNWALSEDVNFQKLDSRVYWEHGWSETVNLVASTAVQDVDYLSRDGRSQVKGLGSSFLGLRYHLNNTGENQLAMQGSIVIPGKGENISDADLGRGGMGFEARGLWGRKWSVLGINGFVDAQAAWIYRPEDNPHSYAAEMTIGTKIFDNVEWLSQAFYGHTESDRRDIDEIDPNSSLKVQESLVYHANKKRSYQIGFIYTAAGRNIVKEQALIASIWQRY